MIHPSLHKLLADARAADLRRAATGAGWRPRRPRLVWRARRRTAPRPVPIQETVTIRYAFADDAQALARLAVLDSSPQPAQPILLAEVDGQLRAALSMVDGAVIADPFKPAAALVELLTARAAQLTSRGPARRGRTFAPPVWRTVLGDELGEQRRR
jgi:hypothetical protein